MNHYFQKYLSVVYLLLFVFQIAINYSSTVKDFSIKSIQSICGVQDHSNDNMDVNRTLIDFENQEEDNEENTDGEDNEEQEEDSEDEFLKYSYRRMSVSNEFSRSYFKYLLSISQEEVKEEFAPPETMA